MGEEARLLRQQCPPAVGLAKAGELAQRGLAAQCLDQQKGLPRILAVAQQAAHRTQRDERAYPGAGGI
jgi:methyl coenzyme M reductase subunit C